MYNHTVYVNNIVIIFLFSILLKRYSCCSRSRWNGSLILLLKRHIYSFILFKKFPISFLCRFIGVTSFIFYRKLVDEQKLSQVAAMHKEVSAQNSNILLFLKMSRCSSESVQDDFSTCLLDKHSTHQMDD